MTPPFTTIRQFNDAGLRAFLDYLRRVKEGDTQRSPDFLVDDQKLSSALNPGQWIDPRSFDTALDMVEYLYPRVMALSLPNKLYDPGLWSWLAAYYFDVICPPDKHDRRRVGELESYIATGDSRKSNRHLISAAIRFYHYHRPHNQLALYLSPGRRSEYLRVIQESPQLFTSPGLIEAIHRMYWNPETGAPYRGTLGDSNRSGSIKRLSVVMNQFAVNYDLQGMSADQILELLPKKEFGRWLEIAEAVRTEV
ncbi:MAG: hypothetical protein KME04_05380 [Pleurocapsa minor GSE-CHR-MK-17-07R]|jgi:hypothetical protein|nr:hypothetical protein [Pleurocapsa minor GSE-CHR-MK 17-07R]